MDNQLFALIVIITWNLFLLRIALKMKRMSDNYTDSVGGDSRVKDKSLVRNVYDTVVELREIDKNQQRIAESVRRNREQNEQ